MLGYLTVEMSTLGQIADDVRLATQCNKPVSSFGSMMALPESDGIIEKALEMMKEARQ